MKSNDFDIVKAFKMFKEVLDSDKSKPKPPERTTREEFISTITDRLTSLSDEELSRMAARAECMVPVVVKK